jgi:hypothetical protein
LEESWAKKAVTLLAIEWNYSHGNK